MNNWLSREKPSLHLHRYDNPVQSIPSSTMQLYYNEYGEGQPLIILHGLLGASGNWHSLSKNVFANHFRVITVDLRNHGRSPHDDVFDYESMVEDVRELYNTLGLTAAHVMGHSMGGKVAMWMALQYNEHVEKLIVVDIAPREYPAHHMHIFHGLRALDLPLLSSRGEIDKALSDYVSEAPVRQFLLKNLASKGKGDYSWKMNLESIYQNYPLINEAVETDRSFTGPSLFIKGGHSSYIRNEDESDIRVLFPTTEFVTVPNAGHWVHAESPEYFSRSVVDFLQK